MHCLRLVLAAVGLLATAVTAAAATPCASFADLDSDNAFCGNVEWIRNRGITLGCAAPGTPAAYCPGGNVTRLQMAAFMNRLGDSLTPAVLVAEEDVAGLDLAAGAVVCRTADYALQANRRRAYLDAVFMASPAVATDFTTDLVISLDGGVTWAAIGGIGGQGSAPPTRWTNLRTQGQLDLGSSATNVRFALRIQRDAGGPASLANGRCNLRVDIAQSPFAAETGTADTLTLLGTDVDGDGVRDDIQRWIDSNYGHSAHTRHALRQMALANNRVLVAGAFRSATALGDVEAFNRAFECLSYVTNGQAGEASKLLLAVTLNTMYRLRAYFDFQSLLAGKTFGLKAFASRGASCIGIQPTTPGG